MQTAVRSSVASRLALLLRRRIGSLREDRDFDTIIRQKHIQIFVFSMVGLMTMFCVQLVTWSLSSTKIIFRDAYVDDDYSSATMLNVMYLSQAIVTSSTIVTLVLLTQKYRLLLMMKRAEWSGANIFEVEAVRGDTVLSTHARDFFISSYSFWKGRLKWQYLTEVIIHIPHPVLWMASSTNDGVPKNLWYKVLQVMMFLRLYLIPDLLHLMSEAYISRFEVVNSDRDLLSVGYQITRELTIKMNFYQSTALFLVSGMALLIVTFGFSVFTLERTEGVFNRKDGEDPAFSSFWNSIWFSYVTATTIGFGEYAPSRTLGRIAAAMCAVCGIGLFTIFSGVLVSRVSLTKEQKHGVEYIATRKGDEVYRDAAAELRRVFFSDIVLPKWRGQEPARVFKKHKGNRMHRAIRKLRGARRELEGSFMSAEDTVLNNKVEALEEMATAVHREVEAHLVEFRQFETETQQALHNVLQKVAMYTRMGNVAV